MACKVERRTTRGEEEGGGQTTTALGQPGRERETNIKKQSLRKKTFFGDTVSPVGVFAPTKNKLLSFQIYQSYVCRPGFRESSKAVLSTTYSYTMLIGLPCALADWGPVLGQVNHDGKGIKQKYYDFPHRVSHKYLCVSIAVNLFCSCTSFCCCACVLQLCNFFAVVK